MTVDQIRRLPESMPGKLERARRPFGRTLILSENILAAHADDFDGHIRCNHTSTDEQLGWFRAGPALNTLK
jgi:hypothetical protein